MCCGPPNIAYICLRSATKKGWIWLRLGFFYDYSTDYDVFHIQIFTLFSGTYKYTKIIFIHCVILKKKCIILHIQGDSLILFRLKWLVHPVSYTNKQGGAARWNTWQRPPAQTTELVFLSQRKKCLLQRCWTFTI